jgi:hypothetical protein
MDEQRRLFRHGFFILLLAFLAWIASAILVKPTAVVAHARPSGLTFGLILVGIGAAWPTLKLSDGSRRLGIGAALTGAYLGLLTFGVASPFAWAFAPKELYNPPEPPPWATAVVWSGTFATLLAMAMTRGFVFSGLRHTADAAPADE